MLFQDYPIIEAVVAEWHLRLSPRYGSVATPGLGDQPQASEPPDAGTGLGGSHQAQKAQVVRPDQVWVSDITYIRLRAEFIYLAVIMDVFTRDIRGWHLRRSLDQTLALLALRRAPARHQAPEIHHSDQGGQYAATAYTHKLQDVNVQISMAEVGAAWQNGYAERLIQTIKEEEVDLSEYEDYNDILRRLGWFLDDVYAHKRIHSSLGYLTPAEFEAQWRSEQAQTPAVH